MGRWRSEVVVIGSGAGGATVAGGLARAGVRVTVIEAGAQRGSPPGTHVRNVDPSESGIDAYAEALNQHLVARHRGFDGLILSHWRMGSCSGGTRISMLRGTPG